MAVSRLVWEESETPFLQLSYTATNAQHHHNHSNGDTPAQPAKPRWGEINEDDHEDRGFLLPPRQVIGPDENRLKKLIEYRFNEHGNKVKIVTTTRMRNLANANVRLSKHAVGSRLTMVSTEKIIPELPRTHGKGTYVPPGKRGGPAATERGGRRNDENSVRVTTLSENAWEADLLELLQPFGAISRVYVVVDQNTGMSKGFGFVSFVNREDAQRATNKLNGYGNDDLILQVKNWKTQPRGLL